MPQIIVKDEVEESVEVDVKEQGAVYPSSPPLQQEDSGVEVPSAANRYVVVLREEGQQERGGASRPSQIALDMACCGVSKTRVTMLLDYVSRINTPLIRLRLSRNPLGPEGVRLLGTALVTNNSLQFLELDACDLVGSPYRPQHEGILALSKGMQSVRSNLRYVNIASNDLQPEGCRILLGALSFHPTLTALDISDNMLSLFNYKQGYLALSYLLQYTKQLCWLSISGNPLTLASASVLKNSLDSNHSLTSLNASKCGIPRAFWLGNQPNKPDKASLLKVKKKSTRKRPQTLLHTLQC